MKITRDTARNAFADAGLCAEIITQKNLCELIGRINQRMRSSGLIKGTYRMRRVRDLRLVAGKKVAELRCKSFYFESREAVTFNQDGFIGFAGWADDNNIAPILEGFIEWVSAISAPTAEAGR